MRGVHIVEQFPGQGVGGPAGHGHDGDLGIGAQAGGHAGAIHHIQPRMTEYPMIAVADALMRGGGNTGGAQRMIGADQEVRGFQWRAQKVFQFGAVVDSRLSLYTSPSPRD